MAIYRGLGGVNREVKQQFRGLGGVNREIKEQYRGLSGVNRKVFELGHPIVPGTGLIMHLDGTVENAIPGTTVEQTHTGNHSFCVGYFGQGFTPNGTVYRITGAPVTSSVSYPYTLHFWYKRPAIYATVSNQDIIQIPGRCCFAVESSKLMIEASNGLNIQSFDVGTAWTHVAFCHAPGKYYLYLNGVQAGSFYNKNLTNPSSSITIGGTRVFENAKNCYSIDEICYHPNALLWDSNFTPPTKPHA